MKRTVNHINAKEQSIFQLGVTQNLNYLNYTILSQHIYTNYYYF